MTGACCNHPIGIDQALAVLQTAAMTVRCCLALPVLLASALTLAAAPPNNASPRTALVIGNAKYESSVGALRNPVNDARTVAKTLRSLGFTVIEEHNATRDELLEAVAGFRARLRGAEVALFYYAGHGISVAGSNYLIPIKSGYNPEGADATSLRLLAETRLFNAEQVVAEMTAAGGRCNLVVLDACRSTPLARDAGTRSLTNVGGLAEMKPPAGSLIAFATDAGRTAQDGDGSNGIYTGAWLKHLRTPGLSIEQVFKRTRADVMQRTDGAQIPAEYSRLVGEDIYLAGPVSEPAPPAHGDAKSVADRPRALKAEPVVIPTPAVINKLAAAGKAVECIEALELATSSRGAGDHAAAPLDALLETVKEEIKAGEVRAAKAETMLKTCDLVLAAVRDCLPPDHTQNPVLTAKAQNRRGDCLLLLDRAEDALTAYDTAIRLSPDDAYPVFNRGRAHRALGQMDEARTDFTNAAGTRFKQPKARKLAQEALEELK